MGYFEDQMGLAAGHYSPDFNDIYDRSGPWLADSQKDSPLIRFPRWKLDLDEMVIWFGTEERNNVVASVQILGTYTKEDGTWLWAWSNPKLQPVSEPVEKLSKDFKDVPELAEPSFTCNLACAWAMASAAAFKMESETCCMLPGELSMFVALSNITELDESDPRSIIPTQDNEAAAVALASYAGPGAVQIGAMLLKVLQGEVEQDEAIEAVHTYCENLDDLSRSEVGKGTPAADDANEIAKAMRQGTALLSVPPNSPALAEGIKEFLSMLEDIARQFGAWAEEE